MDGTLTLFVQALRNAEVEVSPAETLAAAEVWLQLGSTDRDTLRHGLGMALAKNSADKIRFEQCFEQFFAPRTFRQPVRQAMLADIDQQQLLEIIAIKSNHPDVAALFYSP